MLDEEEFREGKITILEDFLQIDMGDVIGKTGCVHPPGRPSAKPGGESADCGNQPETPLLISPGAIIRS